LIARSDYYYQTPLLAVYTGNTLDSLSQIGCGAFGSNVVIQAQAGVTYYFQVSGLFGTEGLVPFALNVAPPPTVSIGYSPYDPTMFDTTFFYSSVYDPASIYGHTTTWTISDGTTSQQPSFSHQFAADGDYTVNLSVTTADGRTGTSTQVIQVRTRDVSINKLSVPQMASVNQTKTINVEVKNNSYSDYVQVILYKGLPGGGEQQIGVLTIYVPARATKPTVFKFSYTFTASDQVIGKVTFRAVANFVNGRDALPSDNTSIATTLVNR
jgi:hypothetical protein